MDAFPDWSPDGAKIAFVSDRDAGDGDIYVMNADGTKQVNLTNNPGNEDSQPAWSPDGQRIAYDSEPGIPIGVGYREIYVMKDDGTDRKRLTTTTMFRSSEDPSWSPDGKKIAFDSDRDGGNKIYIMDADGGNIVSLEGGASPDWSPFLPNGD